MNIQKTDSYIKLSTQNSRNFGKLAIFDLDCTLIKPKKNKTPRNPYSEYVYCYPNVISKLQEYSKNKFQIVIITNQKILKTEDDKKDWIEKIHKFKSELNTELIVLAALQYDIYRKPRLGFLEFIQPNLESFYCGDALGRIRDFSDSDLKFALNLGITCNSPEFIFKNEPELSIDDIINVQINYASIFKLDYYKTFRYLNKDREKEVIIMVGIQGSGKSLLSKWIKLQNAFQIYNIISRDVEKTMKKCLNKMEDSFKNGLNVIIDNTNPTKEARKPFINLAIKYKYKIKIINIGEVGEDYNMASHNNYYRHLKFGIPLIPNIALYKFLKDYQKPEISEGVNQIIELKYFLPTLNLDYFMYLE
jgi:bifunctional polynucleotide phosphatase/kinase